MVFLFSTWLGGVHFHLAHRFIGSATHVVSFSWYDLVELINGIYFSTVISGAEHWVWCAFEVQNSYVHSRGMILHDDEMCFICCWAISEIGLVRNIFWCKIFNYLGWASVSNVVESALVCAKVYLVLEDVWSRERPIVVVSGAESWSAKRNYLNWNVSFKWIGLSWFIFSLTLVIGKQCSSRKVLCSWNM